MKHTEQSLSFFFRQLCCLEKKGRLCDVPAKLANILLKVGAYRKLVAIISEQSLVQFLNLSFVIVKVKQQHH